MKRRSLLLGLLMAVPSRGFCGTPFPDAHGVVAPLRADPREIQYALRLLTPVSRRLLGEAAIGDYFGLYRWTAADGTMFQFDGGGAVFGRFDISGKSNDMESADFYANVPLDWRHGAWSGRFMLYHTSSHLGDDYLKRHGGQTEKHSWDNLRWLLSYDLGARWRWYGGYTYTFRTLPENIGRQALQGGFELTSPWINRHLQFYWANDLQSWERVAWNPMFHSQAGVDVARRSDERRSVSFFVEFGTGHQPQGQFYLQQETRWDLGIKFNTN